MIPTLYHRGGDWWLSSMERMWHDVAWATKLGLTTCTTPEVVDEGEYKVASGGAYKRVIRKHHVWCKCGS